MNYFYEQYLLDLVYGLVFFLIGYSIMIVQPARIADCTLSRHLWLLAMFGTLHGLGEWTRPLASLTLSNSSAKPIVDAVAPLLLIISFFFLLFFGVFLFKEFNSSKIVSIGIPSLLVFFWLIAAIDSYHPDISKMFYTLKGWSRYLLAFPGAFLASLSFFLRYHLLNKSSSTKTNDSHVNIGVIGYIFVFFFYAIFSLVGQFTPLFPLHLLSSDNFTNFTGMPVEIVRTFFGGAILLITLKTLGTFYIVHTNKLQSALKQQTIEEAKSKISQDLHDVTIQSIYATGLRLKYLKRNLKADDNSSVTTQLDYCITNLNNTIKHLRFYITALQYPEFYKDGLKNTIVEIVEEFKTNNNIRCQIITEGTSNQEFPLVYLHQIVQIVKESLTNVWKHAKATEVIVKLFFSEDSVKIVIIDNGVGFSADNYLKSTEVSTSEEEKSFGLKNIRERARNIDAHLDIISQVGMGTKIQIKVPFGGDMNG